MKEFIPEFDTQEFIEGLEDGIQAELYAIIDMLEKDGRLVSPYGEKVEKELFAIRVIQTGNARIFYAYGKNNLIYGLYGYHKKSRKIPTKELKLARKSLKELKGKGLV